MTMEFLACRQILDDQMARKWSLVGYHQESKNTMAHQRRRTNQSSTQLKCAMSVFMTRILVIDKCHSSQLITTVVGRSTAWSIVLLRDKSPTSSSGNLDCLSSSTTHTPPRNMSGSALLRCEQGLSPLSGSDFSSPLHRKRMLAMIGRIGHDRRWVVGLQHHDVSRLLSRRKLVDIDRGASMRPLRIHLRCIAIYFSSIQQ